MTPFRFPLTCFAATALALLGPNIGRAAEQATSQPVTPPTSAPAASQPALAEVTAPAETITPPADPLLFEDGPWKLKFGLFAGSQFIMEREAFWGLADIFAPTAGYNNNRNWTESWFIPTMRLDYEASESLDLYSGLGAAATGNIQRDIFEQGSEWRVSLEQAYGGVRISDRASDVTFDISGGQQPYRYGSGMLIDLGAQNGNQRGAALAAPRKAWEYTGIVKLTAGPLSVDAFLLNYNEITDDDPDTSLFGGKIEYQLFENPADSYIGVAYLNVWDSDMPYIRAPVEIIENGREDTQTINPYLRIRPLRETIPGLYAAVEGAYQWNDYVDLSATAFSAEVGHQWEQVALRPRLSYAYREYSGDDPNTSKLERFDPLFYDGGVHAFASGSNAALAFYNTNVRTHRVALNLTLSQQDILTFSYWRVAALEVDSPLQFGQIGRVQTIGGQQVVVPGVPDQHLSDDLYLEYVRMLTPNAFLTLGVGVSFPGDGLDQAAGRSLDPWLGALVNLSFKF